LIISKLTGSPRRAKWAESGRIGSFVDTIAKRLQLSFFALLTETIARVINEQTEFLLYRFIAPLRNLAAELAHVNAIIFFSNVEKSSRLNAFLILVCVADHWKSFYRFLVQLYWNCSRCCLVISQLSKVQNYAQQQLCPPAKNYPGIIAFQPHFREDILM
jgi:hypothetical protein